MRGLLEKRGLQLGPWHFGLTIKWRGNRVLLSIYRRMWSGTGKSKRISCGEKQEGSFGSPLRGRAFQDDGIIFSCGS